MKDIDNVVFTDEILEKYKDDSEKITELCKKLDDNKIFQKKYIKFLEGKERIIHVSEQENKQLKEKLDCDLQWAFKYDKLVGNWNKLKEYLKGFDIEYLNEVMEHNLSNTLENILNKMQEIEQGSENDE